jgi:hypothetical protein
MVLIKTKRKSVYEDIAFARIVCAEFFERSYPHLLCLKLQAALFRDHPSRTSPTNVHPVEMPTPEYWLQVRELEISAGRIRHLLSLF